MTGTTIQHKTICDSYDHLCTKLVSLFENPNEPSFKLDATLTLPKAYHGESIERKCFQELSTAIFNNTGYKFNCEDYTRGHFVCIQGDGSVGNPHHDCKGRMDVQFFASRTGEVMLLLTLEHHVYHRSFKTETASSQTPLSPRSETPASRSSSFRGNAEPSTLQLPRTNQPADTCPSISEKSHNAREIESRSLLLHCTNCNERTIPPSSVATACNECHATQLPLPKKRARKPAIVEISSSDESNNEDRRSRRPKPLSRRQPLRHQNYRQRCVHCRKKTATLDARDRLCEPCQAKADTAGTKRESKTKSVKPDASVDLQEVLPSTSSAASPRNTSSKRPRSDTSTEVPPTACDNSLNFSDRPARFRKKVKFIHPINSGDEKEVPKSEDVLPKSPTYDEHTFRKCRSCKQDVVPSASIRQACEPCLMQEVTRRQERKLTNEVKKLKKISDRVHRTPRVAPEPLVSSARVDAVPENNDIEQPSELRPTSRRRQSMRNGALPSPHAGIINGFTIGSVGLEQMVLGIVDPSHSAVGTLPLPNPPDQFRTPTHSATQDTVPRTEHANGPDTWELAYPPTPKGSPSVPLQFPPGLFVHNTPTETMDPIDEAEPPSPAPQSDDESPQNTETGLPVCQVCLFRTVPSDSQSCATCIERDHSRKEYAIRRPKRSLEGPVFQPPSSILASTGGNPLPSEDLEDMLCYGTNHVSSSRATPLPPQSADFSRSPHYQSSRAYDFWAKRYASHLRDDEEESETDSDDVGEEKECSACGKLHRSTFKSCTACRAKGRYAWRSRHTRKKAEDVAKEVSALLKAKGSVGTLKPAAFAEPSTEKKNRRGRRGKGKGKTKEEGVKQEPDDDVVSAALVQEQDEVEEKNQQFPSCSFIHRDFSHDPQREESSSRPLYRAYYRQHNLPCSGDESEIPNPSQSPIRDIHGQPAASDHDDTTQLCHRCKKVRFSTIDYKFKHCPTCRNYLRRRATVNRKVARSKGAKAVSSATKQHDDVPGDDDSSMVVDDPFSNDSSISAPPFALLRGPLSQDLSLQRSLARGSQSKVTRSSKIRSQTLDRSLMDTHFFSVPPPPMDVNQGGTSQHPSGSIPPEDTHIPGSVSTTETPTISKVPDTSPVDHVSNREKDHQSEEMEGHKRRCSGCHRMFMAYTFLTCDECRAKRRRPKASNKRRQPPKARSASPIKLIIKIPPRPRKPSRAVPVVEGGVLMLAPAPLPSFT